MKIRSLSNVLYFILAVSCLLMFFFTYDDNGKAFIWIFIPVVLLVAVYAGQAQLDYWWMTNHPVPLDQPILDWLEKFGYFYLSLGESDKKTYENRLSNYLFARDFKLVGRKEQRDLPEDIKAVIASQAIHLTFGQDDFLLDDYDRIFVYPHPFPSPQFPHLHQVETENIDKVIILAMDQAMHGVARPKENYNIALHAYAEAFMHAYPQKEFPEVHKEGWQPAVETLGLSKEQILTTCGHEMVDLRAVHMVAYLSNKEKYKTLCPMEAHEFGRILKL